MSDTIPAPDHSTEDAITDAMMDAIAEAITDSPVTDRWAGVPENIWVSSPRGTFVAKPINLNDLPGLHDISINTYWSGPREWDTLYPVKPFSVWFSNPGENSIIFPGATVLVGTNGCTSFFFRDEEYFVFPEAALVCIVAATQPEPVQTDRERLRS